MRKLALCGTFLGIALLAGGAGMSMGASGGEGPMQRLGQTAIGRLIMGRVGRAITLRAELNLTDAQREAIRSTLQAHKQEIATAVAPVVNAKRALRDAVLADKPDEAAIRKDAEDLGTKIGDAAVVMSKVKAELAEKANLTPEQMQKLAEFRQANDAAMDQFLQNAEK